MERDEINKKVDKVLPLAESGDKDALSKELNSMPFQDRLEVARAMKQAAEDKHLTPLELTVTKDTGGQEHLAGVELQQERSYFNPKRWFGDKYSSEELYTPQDKALGSGMAQQAAEIIRGRNAQLEEAMKGS